MEPYPHGYSAWPLIHSFIRSYRFENESISGEKIGQWSINSPQIFRFRKVAAVLILRAWSRPTLLRPLLLLLLLLLLWSRRRRWQRRVFQPDFRFQVGRKPVWPVPVARPRRHTARAQLLMLFKVKDQSDQARDSSDEHELFGKNDPLPTAVLK